MTFPVWHNFGVAKIVERSVALNRRACPITRFLRVAHLFRRQQLFERILYVDGPNKYVREKDAFVLRFDECIGDDELPQFPETLSKKMRTRSIHRSHSVSQTPQLDSENEDGWTCALSKGMRRRLKAKGYTSPLSITLPVPTNSGSCGRRTVIILPDDSPSALSSKFDVALASFLRPTSLVAVVLAQLRPRFRCSASFAPLLCLGLGNPAVDTASLRQLAFLAALVQMSEGIFSPEKTFVYDPVLKTTSRNFIRELGFCILSSNLEGHYQLPRERPTLVFLPHCPIALAEGLVACNWHLDVLNRLTFLSCPLKPRAGIAEVPCIAHLQPFRSYSLLKTEGERDFEGLRIEWFHIPPGVDLGAVKTSDKAAASSSDLLTFEAIPSFIDGGDTKAIDEVA
ncbi:SRR1-like protein [Taenia solium]|eukprot:TsM_000898600 transcript=TsM_000898600 gene=TsM_000898600